MMGMELVCRSHSLSKVRAVFSKCQARSKINREYPAIIPIALPLTIFDYVIGGDWTYNLGHACFSMDGRDCCQKPVHIHAE
uniref:Uncharacterized protein n=1 Tax=Daphnia galeata TaxID=27404 RepID=A0A8J2S2I7_9CRUS|nr:unnamed protein product [Daphnia galeata]